MRLNVHFHLLGRLSPRDAPDGPLFSLPWADVLFPGAIDDEATLFSLPTETQKKVWLSSFKIAKKEIAAWPDERYRPLAQDLYCCNAAVCGKRVLEGTTGTHVPWLRQNLAVRTQSFGQQMVGTGYMSADAIGVWVLDYVHCGAPACQIVTRQLVRETSKRARELVGGTAKILRYCDRCGRQDTQDKPFKRCGRCNVPAYCSRECQKADWPAHRPLCVEKEEKKE